MGNSKGVGLTFSSSKSRRQPATLCLQALIHFWKKGASTLRSPLNYLPRQQGEGWGNRSVMLDWQARTGERILDETWNMVA